MKKYFIIIILINFLNILSNTNNYIFKNLTTSDGLSSNLIKTIYQDKKGFLWIGTYNGINRYDGQRIRQFFFDPDNLDSMPDVVQRTDFFEDKDGNIWFGTKNGLSRFNWKSGKFTNFINEPGDKDSIGDNNISDIAEDKDGQLWIATTNGISKFNNTHNTFYNYYLLRNKNIKNEFSHFIIYFDSSGNLWTWNINTIYKYNNNSFNEISTIKQYGKLSSRKITAISNSENNNLLIGTKNGLNVYNKTTIDNYYTSSSDLCNDHITTILKTENGKILIGTKNGLNIFNEKTNDFIKIKDSIEEHKIVNLFEDKNNKIWVATDKGLKLLNELDNKLELVNTDKKTQLNFRHFNCMFEDRSGVLWIGTYGYGLYKFSIHKNKFNLIRKNDDSKDILSNRIRAIYKNKNILFVGNNDGLYLIDREKGTSALYNDNQKAPFQLNSFPINIIFPFKKNEILIGSWKGLKKFLIKERRFEPLFKKDKTLTDSVVFDIIIDRKRTIWLGTNKGVFIADEKAENILYSYTKGKTDLSLSDNFVYKLFRDSFDNIWIGTGNGLNRITKNRKEVFQYKKKYNSPSSLSYNYISSIIEDSNNDLWIGTTGGGLNKYNYKTSNFSHYTKNDGLSSNIITAIIEDKKNNLWISTYNGITKFNLNKQTFKNYYESDGLQKGDFNTNAGFIGNDQEIFFGGMNGLNSFYPDKIKYNTFVPPVCITNFLIEGVSIKKHRDFIGTDFIIDKGIFIIPYNTKNFTIEFAALDFNIPEANSYEYRFENRDKNWIKLKNKNSINFRSLDPGKYKIRIRGSNNDGVWNKKGTYINIIITPPFWFTWWFKSIIFILSLTLIFILSSKYKKKIKARYRKENLLNEMYLEKGISKREKEIIGLVIKGKNNKEIEDELFISIRTVNSHKYNIYKKLGVKNSGELKHLIVLHGN